MEELASVLGPDETLFISQDDKARVSIGKTAANKQTSLFMHLDYRVRLPDHDWVVADKYKLIPSVYAFIKIDPDKFGDTRAVTYSEPTSITIRSAKHSSRTALSHATDFNELMNCPDCEDFCRNKAGEFKPVVMMTTDGGRDENPRYEKTIQCAIDHRQGERMVVWTSRMNSEHVDWFDDNDDENNEVDVQEIYPVPVNNDVEDIIPIIEMDEMITNCWEDC